jgi:hypothetical protein
MNLVGFHLEFQKNTKYCFGFHVLFFKPFLANLTVITFYHVPPDLDFNILLPYDNELNQNKNKI